MYTYWVTDKKVPDSTDETMLNPFQRLRLSSKPALVPSSPPVSSPPPMSHTLFNQPRRLHRVSPKPDEWPEADRRLSVDTRQRSGTLPSLGVPPSLIAHGRTTRHGSLSTLSSHVLPPSSLAPPYPNTTSGTSTPVTRDMSSRNNSISSEFNHVRVRESEYNIVRLRESISLTLPTITEASPSQLTVFAAVADENARQARRLADWAAELARAAAKASRGREDSTVVQWPSEGTPVDPEPVTSPHPMTDVATANDTHTNCNLL